MTPKDLVLTLFWFGLLNVGVWILTGSEPSAWLGVALMAPAFILCIAQAMRYIEGFHPMHKFTRTKTASTILSTCDCGHSFESTGHDPSSRAAVMTWELQHECPTAA